MIPIRQFDALLQTQSLNNKMFQTLVQGSEDTAIKATIQQDGKNIQIDTGAAGAIDGGDWWYISAEGTLLGIPVHKGDRLQAMVDNPDTADNTAANTDWKVLHSYHEADSRFSIDNLALVADTPATVNHGLGYKFVHVSVADATGDAVDVQVNYVDENNLTLTANTSVTVSGVVSI